MKREESISEKNHHRIHSARKSNFPISLEQDVIFRPNTHHEINIEVIAENSDRKVARNEAKNEIVTMRAELFSLEFVTPRMENHPRETRP